MSWRRGRNFSIHPRGRGNGTSRGGTRIPEGGGICRHFQRGSCRFGANCRFSHDTASDRENRPTGPPPDDNFVDFKRLLRSGIMYGGCHGTHEQAAKLWASAVLVLGGVNQEIQQFLAKDLINDEFMGLQLINETVKLDGISEKRTIGCAYDFLRVITHPSLLDPLSVDSFVSTIYNFFGGRNGEKATNFLLQLCRRLTAYQEEYGKVPVSTITELVSLMLKALAELLNREARARFNESVPTLLDNFQALVALAQPKQDADAITSRVNLLRRLVAREATRLSNTNNESHAATNTPFIRSTFPTEIILPGGRHDNDSADISQIQILPTYGEISCDTPECLLSTDFTRPHFLEDPVQRHIDSAFRLLRHDIFGPVKDVLKDLLAQETSGVRHKPRVSGDASARLYTGASIRHVFVERNGLEAVVAFDNPHQLRNKTDSERRKWWQESSRLEEGSLVAFASSRGDEKLLLFFEVTIKNTANENGDGKKASLVDGWNAARIGVKLTALSQNTLGLLTRLHGERITGVLVEFHGLIPATFVPVLSNLQQMMREGEFSFHQWIVPTGNPTNDADTGNIPPPAYARDPEFHFSLDPILQDGRLPVHSQQEGTLSVLQRGTGLDRGQCEALVAALTREYALIQGPPGTGKSYVGVQLLRVLLENKAKAGLGPILIICYTNHALDQFLIHLLSVGISKIIRIGGRSQAEELEGKNLRVVRGEVQKTRVESQILGETYGRLEVAMDRMGATLKPLHQTRHGLTWAGLEHFLERESKAIHEQLGPIDQDGFKTVGGDSLTAWLGDRPKGSDAQIEALKNVDGLLALRSQAEINVDRLSKVERWALAESWLTQARSEQTQRLFERLDHADELRQTINNVHDDVNRRTLLQADVIGVTTTGLARHIAVLRRVHPKVIICEEAAEVMEAHLVSALMPGVEHFIQIGDHRQLRPQILNYSLSLETQSGQAWQLDRSQFERRAVGEPGMLPAPVAQLSVQRRMRPDISRLISRVYPNLRDHQSVRNLPDVVGMRENLFWLDHNHPEDSGDEGARVKSHSNEWEVDMTTALVRHLVRQGEYAASDIALLTPYTGQLRKLRAALSKDFEIFLGERDLEVLAFEDDGEGGSEQAQPEVNRKPLQKKQLIQTLRLATVDNFQGEEAKVIVVSLVRSNQRRKVGFLRTENRINVLLSRAQHGMYLVGNTETYLHVDMWSDVHSQLVQAGAVGEAIALSCPRHPETPILCSEPEDFVRKSPEGGCDLPCDDRLEPCGHRCRARCHSRAMHDAFLCPRECPRIRSTCDHTCPKLCGEACGSCLVKVSDVELPCGHITNRVKCYETQDLSRIRCTAKVEKEVPGCGHVVEVECGKSVESELFSCPVACEKALRCGHTCPGSCGRCRNREGHLRCTKVCDRPYGTCNHRCSKTCHEEKDCGSCGKRCEVQCPHSHCAASCSEPCAPCIEKCTWSCQHRGACTMPCAAPCDKLPCDERCGKVLECGHQCPSFCGEECPDRKFCQVCGDHGAARVDFTEFKEYAEVDLSELPVVVLTCGHFYTGESLDLMVGMNNVYSVDSRGKYDGLRDISAALAKDIPVCPDCRRPIRQFSTRRYNRVINKAVMDETSKRFLSSGQRSLEELEKRLVELEEGFRSQNIIGAKNRHDAGYKLIKDVGVLHDKMNTEHHPAKKLHDAIIMRQRTEGYAQPSLAEKMQDLKVSPASHGSGPVSALDKQVTLRARLLKIKVYDAMLRDKLSLGKERDIPPPTLTAVARFLKDCTGLVADAADASLPRISIAAILAYAGIFQLQAGHSRSQTGKKSPSPPWDFDMVRDRLGHAGFLCDGLPDGEELREAVDVATRLFQDSRYEEVTPQELEAIKRAMISGRGGIYTHSGHWYNCVNGHPFAIGECGMPMELARCPECGAPIGGQHHQLVEGATRATAME